MTFSRRIIQNLSIVALLAIPIAPSKASDYTIAILQSDSPAPAQSVTCKGEKKICFLSIPIRSETEINLHNSSTLGILIYRENDIIDFDFFLSDRLLSTAVQGWGSFFMNLEEKKVQTGKVAVYLPASGIKDDPKGLRYLAIRTSNKKVADLDIFVKEGSP